MITESSLSLDELQEFHRRKDILTDCLLQKAGVEGLVRTAASLLGCPTILTTNFYRVIVMEDLGLPVNDPIWTYAAQTGYCSAEAVASFELEGITRDVLSSDRTILLDSGLGKAIPRLLHKVQVFGKPGAYIGVFHAGRNFRQVDLLTTDLLCNMLSLMFEWSPEVSQFGLSLHEGILSDLLTGALTSETILKEQMMAAGWDALPGFQCVLFSPEDGTQRIDNTDYLCQSLLRQFSAARVLRVTEGLMMLLNFPSDHANGADDAKLKDFAVHYHLRAFISSRFDRLIHLSAHYEACTRLSKLPGIWKSGERLVRFEDKIFLVLGQILSKQEQRFLVQTRWHYLHNYDERNETEFCKTLRVYIECGCSTTRAAAALYIHRNTMMKRLTRITELSGLELSDGYALFHFYLTNSLHTSGQ